MLLAIYEMNTIQKEGDYFHNSSSGQYSAVSLFVICICLVCRSRSFPENVFRSRCTEHTAHADPTNWAPNRTANVLHSCHRNPRPNPLSITQYGRLFSVLAVVLQKSLLKDWQMISSTKRHNHSVRHESYNYHKYNLCLWASIRQNYAFKSRERL